MDIKKLRCFVTINQTGSMSAAAVKLSINQSALSRHIQSLEAELSYTLYRRTGRGMELTPEGRVFEQYARTILETHESALLAMRDSHNTDREPVVVGLPTSLSSVLVPGLVSEFKKRFPHTPLKINEAYSGHLTDWLIDGKVDVAVLYDTHTTPIKGLQCDFLLEDSLVLVAPSSQHVALAEGDVHVRELAHLPMILPSQPHGVRVLLDRAMQRMQLEPRIYVEIDSLYSSLLLVESGAGYTVVSQACVRSWVDGNRVQSRPLIEPNIKRRLVTAISPQCASTRPIRAFASILRNHVTRRM